MSQRRGWIPYKFMNVQNPSKDPIKFEEDGQGYTVTDVCAYHGSLIFGDSMGHLHILKDVNNPTFIDIPFCDAPIMKLLAPPSTPALIALINYTDSIGVIMADPESNTSYAETSIQKQPGTEIQFITSSHMLEYFALTFDKHTVYVYQVPRIGSKKMVFECIETIKIDETITSLHYATSLLFENAVFITTDKNIYAYKQNKKAFYKKVIDTKGVATEFACLNDKGLLAVARGQDVVFYNFEGVDSETTPIDLPVDPLKIMWYRTYLLAFSTQYETVKVYDAMTRCTYGGSKFGKDAKYILYEWGQIILLMMTQESSGSTCKIATLTEFSTEEKLKSLCDNRQFEAALKLAENAHIGAAKIADIHRQLGDDRHNAHAYADAIQQYILAIGYLEPSYVINKFLEPQYAELLVQYLEALHDKGLEEPLQTQLRFNCYTKLGRVSSLLDIVDKIINDKKNDEEIEFNIAPAIKVLVESGNATKASELALAFGDYIMYCQIKEKDNKILDVRDIIFKVPVLQTKIKIICDYGAKILSHLDETEALSFTTKIAGLCSINLDAETIPPKMIFHIFLEFPKMEYKFLTLVLSMAPQNLTDTLWNRLISTSIIVNPAETIGLLKHPQAKYNEETAFLSVRVALTECENVKEQAAKYEKSLQKDPNSPIPEILLGVDLKANDAKYGQLSQAMEYMFHIRKQYRMILNTCEPSQMYDICLRYQKDDPNIWSEGLQLAVRSGDIDVTKQISSHVLDNGIMLLNELLPILKGIKSTATFDIISEFTIKEFERIASETNEKMKKLQQEDEALEKMYVETNNLQNNCKVFRGIKNGMTCGSCQQKIDSYPFSCFKCGHTFHQPCLGDEPDLCPICRQKAEQIAHDRIARVHEHEEQQEILTAMKNTNDGIGILEEVLKSGILDNDLSQEDTDDIKKFLAKFGLGEE